MEAELYMDFVNNISSDEYEYLYDNDLLELEFDLYLRFYN